MAFRELMMSDVREVLRRWQAGESLRQIGRAGVVDRKTARRYVQAAKALGVERGATLDEEMLRAVLVAVQRQVEGRPLSSTWAKLEARQSELRQWLVDDRLQLTRVQELLMRSGLEVPYSTLRRFAHREVGWREREITVRIDDAPPGEEAQMDFGEMGRVETGLGPQRLWVLVVVLSYSRHTFVYPLFEQTLPAICEGLDAAWAFFGGVPKRVVPDNPKPIVTTARNAAPRINERFLEYAQARGFFVDPARVRKPKDKARVERTIQFVRERWFKGERHSGNLADLRMHAARWCSEVAGRRLHGTTRRVPLDVFESEEQPKLLPPPTAPFDVPDWVDAKVHPDHHVQVCKALYSVPTRYVGQHVRVRIDRTSVRIYFRHELVKQHGRVASGQRSTDPSDYPEGKSGYATRSLDRLLRRAHAQSEAIGQFAEELLAGPLPWTRMRQAHQLLRLCERYGVDRVNEVCRRSLEFEVFDVPRLERMLRRAQQLEKKEQHTGRVVAIPPGRFQRPKDDFRTLESKGGDE